MIYGANYQLQLDSVPGEGTCARIVIPEMACCRRGRSPEDVADLRTVVVDDEQLAREELCFLLEQLGGIEIVGQAGNGVEALHVIERVPARPGDAGRADARPDRVRSRATLLMEAGIEPQLVFVTAFDQHAIEAFEVNAVDYLLKPVEPERLATAVERARKRMAVGPTAPAEAGRMRDRPGPGRVLQLLSERQGRREQLAIKVDDRFLLVQADEVIHASRRGRRRYGRNEQLVWNVQLSDTG